MANEAHKADEKVEANEVNKAIVVDNAEASVAAEAKTINAEEAVETNLADFANKAIIEAAEANKVDKANEANEAIAANDTNEANEAIVVEELDDANDADDANNKVSSPSMRRASWCRCRAAWRHCPSVALSSSLLPSTTGRQ